VGSFVAVCVADGGVEASVLRRGPYGFETLSLIDAPDGGALAWDTAVAQLLSGTPDGSGWPGGWPDLWATAREARRAATTAAAVTVAAHTGPVVVPASAIDGAGVAVVDRAAQVTSEAVKAAEIEPTVLRGLVVAGDLATPPMVAAIAAAAGVQAAAVEPARWAAVLGAARVTGPRGDQPAAMQAPALPPMARVAVPAAGWAASALLFFHFLSSAYRVRPAGLYTTGDGLLLANWAELGLASVFALIATLTMSTVLASLMPVLPTDPFAAHLAPRPGGTGRVLWRDSQQIGVVLVAATAIGAAVAGLYALAGSVYLGWWSGPFLRWTLLPLLPVAVTVWAAVVLATRTGRIPAMGWHAWLAFPPSSVLATMTGMVLVQVSVSTGVRPQWHTVLLLVGKLGGALIGLGVALVLVRRPRSRLILALPTVVVFGALTTFSTTKVLACVYVAAVTVWWGKRVWVLANRPRTALPYPR